MTKEERLKRDGWDGQTDPILFYGHKNPFGVFSNFSRHSVRLPHPFYFELVTYPTSEHRYQAMKAVTPEEHDYVWDAESPGQSKDRGQEIHLREDWGNSRGDICWYVMLEVCIAKAFQNREVERALDATGDALMYEDSPTDDIWGWRYSCDYRGKNLLGLTWMQVRDLFYA